MPAKPRESFPARIFLLSGFFLIWSVLLISRFVHLQIFQYADLNARAERQQSRSFQISPQRGTIYDRRGRELAVSVNVDSVYAIASEIGDKKQAADALAQALGLKRQILLARLKGTRGFLWLKRKVDYAEVAKVKALALRGVYLEKESKRFYPNRELAAHVLGYVGMDDEGLSGLEFAYQRKIGGLPGRVLLRSDARQVSFSSLEKAPEPGEDLVLTIDQTLQYIAEQELAAQVKQSNALGGTVIVMEPHSGEILAMASHPAFNPNHYAKYSSEYWRNRAILSIYEPGSTFKIFTAATALEEHLARPDDLIDCMNGSIVVGKHRIRDHKPYGVLPVREVVAYSSNVGAVQLGFRIGKERFEKYIRTFGFGAPTSVDLPGEAKGLLRPSSQWPTVTLANIAMGQGIGVTPMQLVTAVSSIANGGYRVKPRIVLRSRSSTVEKVSFEPEADRSRILSSRTTSELTEMLTGVVKRGTAKGSQLEGFSAAGKTGTAQKIDPNGRYSHSRFIASFVGFAPAERPALAMVVTIDEPRGHYYGGEVAAPVFRNIAEQALRYLSISPDQELTPAQMAKRRQLQASIPDLAHDQFEPVNAVWEGEDAPPSSQPVSSSSALPVTETEAPGSFSESATIEVPDLRGRSMRAAIAELSKIGLQLGAFGSGLVVEQSPAPTSKVEPGS
ncbi:MAG TPA: penicillin-binding transpeptidase domain-containing protein, partial [Terriglobia bacterium]|nr:penicillin-binding transpeptidase domain-containing protein [Terriglobia bacterium]